MKKRYEKMKKYEKMFSYKNRLSCIWHFKKRQKIKIAKFDTFYVQSVGSTNIIY